MLDEVKNIRIMDAALTNFDRFEFAVVAGERKPSPCSMGAVPNQAKTFLPRIPLETTIKQRPDYRGFFVRAVIATIDKAPAWVSCNVNTGWYMPLYSKPRSVGERLHNSVEPKRQNGQPWIISTRHAHLVWKQMEQVVKSIIFSCRFEESIV